MENWRKKGHKCYQELAKTKSNHHYGKPPLDGCSSWQPAVPLWEKRFVTTVGSLSWKKFSEARKFTHLYGNILQWDDSAGEEAFRASKENFYVKFHGLPCHTDLDNPDLYIDEVDWNAGPDENLMLELELESESVAPADSNHDPVVIFGDAFQNLYGVYSHGWGEVDENVKKENGWGEADVEVKKENGWGEVDEEVKKVDKDEANWENYINDWDVDLGAAYNWWDSNENHKKASEEQQGYWGWNANAAANNADAAANDDGYYYGNNNCERRDRWQKTSRFHGDNSNHRNHSWRNNANRRKPGAQGHGNRRSYVPNIRAHGNQWIQVQP